MNITENLWKQYHAKLLSFIVGRVGDSDLAEDILQDVFLKIYSQLDSLKDETKLESWLYQITRNAVVDFYRTKKPTVELPESISAPDPQAGDQILQELEACLRPMIEQLPVNYRVAIILSELEGKTQQEVSEQQNISLSGAKSRVQRGRTLLKGMLYQCCQFEFDRNGKAVDYKVKDKDCNAC